MSHLVWYALGMNSTHSSGFNEDPKDASLSASGGRSYPPPAPEAAKVVRKVFFNTLIRHMEQEQESIIQCIERVFNIWMTMLDTHTVNIEDWLIGTKEVESLTKLKTLDIFLTIIELRTAYIKAAEDDAIVRDWIKVAMSGSQRTRALREAKRIMALPLGIVSSGSGRE